ncbi:enoyl-CoA hydratase/carnithine racemase [Bradyrhizobium sp. LM4.3]
MTQGNAETADAGASGLLRIERADRVLTVGLNRPAKRNALNDGIILEIGECFASLPENIGAVVIHGIGDHFSSGLDLSELTDHDATGGLLHSQMWHRVFDRIQYSRVPVIAALRGAVIGAAGWSSPVRRIFASPSPRPISPCRRGSAASSSAAAAPCGCRG